MGCGAFALLALGAALLALSLAYVRLLDGLPSYAGLPGLFDPEQGAIMQPTRLYDRTGQRLLLTLENPGIPRRYRKLDPNQPGSFSPQLLRAAVGVLDPSYWNSPGVSLVAITNPQPVTIAERLVSDLLLWQEPESLRRSVRMRLLAAQVVARYGHVQVLEWYLNSASFGHLAYGADSAARLYLGKSAAEVNLAESVMLLAAHEAPALNPLDAPADAQERQRALLTLLFERGSIGEAEYLQAAAETVVLANPTSPGGAPAAAFTRLALARLEEQFGSQRLARGGLRVITTLDLTLQNEVACAAQTQLARLTGRGEDSPRLPDGSPCASARLLPTLALPADPLPDSLTASAVVLDPQTGQVLALLGDSTVDGESLLLSPRAPGSMLTPFAAVAGYARGMAPATLVWDIPSSLPEGMPETQNPDGVFHGPVRLREALANDYLVPVAQMIDRLGAPGVWRLAGAMGLPSVAGENSPALIFSGGRVTPLEMAHGYSVFSNLGQPAGVRANDGSLRPAVVLYVEDLFGNVWLDASQPETQAVTSPQIAYLAHHVLSDATARWASLGYPNPLEIGRPVGAKIGQVQGGAQFWTAGYTPQRTVVFWLGLPDAEPVVPSGLQPRMAAGMWHAVMQYAARELPPSDWPQPAGITRIDVCDPSGLLPTQACPGVVREIFMTGSEPSAPDSLYRTFQINRETGRLATVFTPPGLVEERTFLVPPAQARGWAAAAGLPIPPEDYDAILSGQPDPNVQITAPAVFAYTRGEVRVRGTAAGENFRAYQVLVGQGLNPDTWQQIGLEGNAPVEEDLLAVWDTHGLEGLYAVRLQVVRQDQTVDIATIQVTLDNTPPVARIPYPVNEQVFRLSASRQITFQADVQDAVGVQRLEWSVDNQPVGTTTQEPFVLAWRAVRGAHVLSVQAFDLAGNPSAKEQVRFTVE